MLVSTFRKTSSHDAAVSGYSLMELAMVIVMIGILAAFATMSWGSTGESRDASMVQSAQATLQTVISQGAARRDMTPTQLVTAESANIVNAMRQMMQQNSGKVSFSAGGAGGNFSLSINSTSRGATYAVDTQGNVTLAGLSGGWSHYSVGPNGVIKKN